VRQGKRPVSRGVARRNAKLKALRELVGRDRAIVAVDLASQRQAAVVCDHDSVVLARRMFRGSAWCVGEILAWAGPVARKVGFAGVVLACEPTGHRWKPLVVTVRAGSIPAVCVQPLQTAAQLALQGGPQAGEGRPFEVLRSRLLRLGLFDHYQQGGPLGAARRAQRPVRHGPG
jgi:hypothetical protein